ANADGTFAPLAAKHVDTGMGFERVAGIYATTNGFKNFDKDPSNYAADVFAPLFKKVADLSGKTYQATVPTKREGLTEQENIDIAFRVLADHARCVSCAIADGIMPGNDGRNYVIRRILRRGILYGKKIGFKVGDFSQLVAPVVESLGHVFPELKQQQEVIRRVIQSEEESFGRTLDRGLQIFAQRLVIPQAEGFDANGKRVQSVHPVSQVSGETAFELYDTYGFPLDMTQLLATERGLTVDTAKFEELMEQQRERARAAQKKEIVVAATEGENVTVEPTKFLGYAELTAHAKVVDVVKADKDTFLVFDQTPFYGEMGGQAGDTGHALLNGHKVDIVDTVKDKFGRHLHKVAPKSDLSTAIAGAGVTLQVDAVRRRAISRHHSAAHLIHWALRKVLGTHVRQAGTSKTPDRMRFDFSHFEAMTHAQLKEVEQLVNDKVLDNAKVDTYETEFDKKPEGTLAFFGDKYGKFVRVVDIGGYSRELCGGTHVATTGEIGLIKVVAEMAVAAGTRRIEAAACQAAIDFIAHEEEALKAVNARLNAGVNDV
ncbi:MAG TPA: alanine--tRNA ligase, partial [Archangium sp.]